MNLSLKQSIQTALKNNPMILQAEAEVSAAEGILGQARGSFFPQLSVEGGVGRTYSKPTTVQTNLPGMPPTITLGTDEQADINTGSITFVQPLFNGGKMLSVFGTADKGLQIKREELKKKKQEVSFETIKTFYGILKAEKIVLLNHESVEMAQRHLNKLKLLFKTGGATRTSLLREKLELTNTQIRLNKAIQGLEILKNQFNALLGNDLSAPVGISEKDFIETAMAPYSYQDLLAAAYKFRPEWKQYLLSQRIAEEGVRAAYSNFWPSLSLVGNYNASLTKYSTYQNDAASWRGLLFGSWKLFDGMANINRVKESKAKLASFNAAKINIKNAIALETRNAQFTLTNTKDNIEASAAALEIANENFRLTSKSFDLGGSSSLDLIDAQVSLTSAGISHVEAQYELQIARANINKAVGRDLY